MTKIRFGDHPDFERQIRLRLDGARYFADFGSLRVHNLGEYDAIVPLRITDYNPLWDDTTLERKTFLIPSRDTTAMCDDKKTLNDFLVARGFKFLVPEYTTQVPVDYPYVAKSRRSESGQGTWIIKTPEEALERGISMAQDLIFQDIVTGSEEYAVHLLCKDGHVAFHRIAHYIMPSDQVVKGPVVPTSTNFVENDELLSLMKDIVAALQYTGVCCIDLKYSNGNYWLFEINPRFGFSLSFEINPFMDAYVNALIE
ncbi:MAG: ATP-grasp domain-containing protein [Alsobacter sp.]